MEYFVQQLINGVTLGSIYGLIAIGYTMVYGIIGMINFAHGDVFMISAFIALITILAIGVTGASSVAFILLALLIVLVIAMSFTAAWGWTVERLAYRPLRGSFRLAPLITAIGMSIVLQNFVQISQGARVKPLQPIISGGVTIMRGHTEAGPIVVQFIIVTTIVLMVAFSLIIARTPLGRAQRACEQDAKMASLLGVNVDHGRRAGRRRRAALRAVLWRHRFLYRLRRRHQGLHRRCPGRHRLAARRHAWRSPDRPDRDFLVRLFHRRIQGCRGLFDPGDCLDLSAVRPARPAGG
jgi:branched-chain amino acid transport system permease protein